MGSSSGSSKGCYYDVILSFCPTETETKYFVEGLYKSFSEAEIPTIYDQGVDILEGAHIEHSKIAVPIFSKEYASSQFCLGELTKIVECYRRNATPKIFPIFYDVRPYDMGLEYESCNKDDERRKSFPIFSKRPYDMGLEYESCNKDDDLKRKTRYHNHIFEHMRSLLRGVDCSAGWDLKNTYRRNMKKLFRTVVSTIQLELQKVNGFPGIEFCMNHVMKLLEMENDGVLIIGIHGKDAWGNTTLAKVVYDHIFHQFETSSFLSDIKQKSKKNGVQSLQAHLINELLGGTGHVIIHSVEQGIDIISQKFRKTKVLILVDDISKEEHLHVLARQREWFGSGSRIILTTRNRDLLDVLHVDGSSELTRPQRKPKILFQKPRIGSQIQDSTAQILDDLKRDKYRAITILGSKGVGKTTLAMNVHDRIVEGWNNFSGVYWVYASMCCTVHSWQSKFAELFDIDLPEENTVITRSEILSKCLQTKRKFLVFLDGVQNFPTPEDLGISFETSGCRLILTSESDQLYVTLDHQMLKRHEIYPLDDDAAWTWFKETIGGYHRLLLQPRYGASLISQECGGLPLAIITVARSMKTVEYIEEWKDVLEQLRRKSILDVLKLCYDRLRNEQVKQCLLYCAVYPQDYEIPRKDLIEFFTDIGLIREDNKQMECDRGHAIINQLEDANLLERGRCHLIADNVDFYSVRMHSLVRDMVLRFKQPEFLVKAGISVNTIIDEGESAIHVAQASLEIKSLNLVSLMHNCKKDISISPKCPLLSVFLLQGNRTLKSISSCFLQQMPMLRVLDLSETSIYELPTSVSDLVELSALILRNCKCLEVMPSLAKLTQLRKLDMRCTAVKQVPNGMEMLVKLEYLSLHKTGIGKLPTGILLNLQNLRLLEVDMVSRIEVAGLRNLEIIVASFYDLEKFCELISTTDSGSEEGS